MTVPFSPEGYVPSATDAQKRDYILRGVQFEFGVTREELQSKDRHRRIVRPRQIAMYLMRKYTNMSLPSIGRILGGRDHTTVMYGIEVIQNIMKHDQRLVQFTEKVGAALPKVIEDAGVDVVVDVGNPFWKRGSRIRAELSPPIAFSPLNT